MNINGGTSIGILAPSQPPVNIISASAIAIIEDVVLNSVVSGYYFLMRRKKTLNAGNP